MSASRIGQPSSTPASRPGPAVLGREQAQQTREAEKALAVAAPGVAAPGVAVLQGYRDKNVQALRQADGSARPSEVDGARQSQASEVHKFIRGQSPAVQRLKEGFQWQMKYLAERSPEAFYRTLSDLGIEKRQAAQLFRNARDRCFPLPANIQFVDRGELGGEAASLAPSNGGTVSLAKDLAGNHTAMMDALTREIGKWLAHPLPSSDLRPMD